MLLCIGLLFEPLLIPVLWVMLVLTAITAIQRFVKVVGKRPRRSPRHASSCGGRAARAGALPARSGAAPACRDAAPDSGGSAGPSRPGSIAAAGRCRDLRRLPGASGIARTCPTSPQDAVPAGLGANLAQAPAGDDRAATPTRRPHIGGVALAARRSGRLRLVRPLLDRDDLAADAAGEGRLDGFTEEGYAAYIQGGLAAGRGLILALPHLGGWEWAGAGLTDQGHPVTVIVEQLHPPGLFDWFVRLPTTSA